MDYEGQSFQEFVGASLSRLEEGQRSIRETLEASAKVQDGRLNEHDEELKSLSARQNWAAGRSSIFGLMGGSLAAWILGHLKLFG